MKEQGRIIKIVSNQYEVLDASNHRNLCVAMGKLRKHQSPVVGDLVSFERFSDQIGIQKIEKRKNELIRPAIANVDQAIIVMSCKDPDFSTTLIDRLIFQIAYANITPILCITKLDLIEKDDPIHNEIKDYRKSGYQVFESGKGYATEDLCEALKGKISVLTGQSGAGKSSLLNRIEPAFQLQTQEISKALGRGKHTTRHCELHEVAGGWVADTPGFSSMDFSHMEISLLQERIPDFKPYIFNCKFNDCIHMNEPGCRIQEAVAQGDISPIRYEHYKEVVSMIRSYKPKY
ncbi:ribosome small subunit-dependent GTPase A [[Eubacterium] hominis]|uniref:ribosome small subunit-dependent GTPase A n=1 Tax=[Eubacterium] hominis TaxID=2764325 RepID=UPI003A4E519E